VSIFGDALLPKNESADIVSRLPFFAALLLTIAARSSAPSRVTPPKIGQQAPSFALLDQNRKRVSLAEASGTKVVLVFYRGYW
jgi:hypothetical protein